jgi:hypothetical protein
MQEITEGAVAFVLFFNMEDSSFVLFFMSTFCVPFFVIGCTLIKKENQIFLICKKIRRDRVHSKSYINICAFPHNIMKPFLIHVCIYDFAPDPI